MVDRYPNRIHVDLKAIRHNFGEVRRKIPASQKILCVVKSNAYGHGLEAVSQALADEGADFFGVRDIDEGTRLRHSGIETPILFLLGILDQAFDEVIENDLTPVVFDLETARAFNDHLKKKHLEYAIHIKVDSGMTRLGVPANQAAAFFEELRGLSHLRVEGVLTHLADATDEEYTRKQTQAITTVRQQLVGAGWEIPLWHFANSIGAVRRLFPESQMVRAGLVLYGAYPTPALKSVVDLKPALEWTAQVLDIKEVAAGTPISYECTFVTRRPSRIAVLPIGYADGYPRLLSNRGKVLVRGHMAPIVGRICMDLCMVDVTDIPGVERGDLVTLIGKNGDCVISAEEVAQWADTISYEILAGISTRVPRNYQG